MRISVKSIGLHSSAHRLGTWSTLKYSKGIRYGEVKPGCDAPEYERRSGLGGLSSQRARRARHQNPVNDNAQPWRAIFFSRCRGQREVILIGASS